MAMDEQERKIIEMASQHKHKLKLWMPTTTVNLMQNIGYKIDMLEDPKFAKLLWEEFLQVVEDIMMYSYLQGGQKGVEMCQAKLNGIMTKEANL